MSILVQEIVNRSLSALDAEGSERYLFDQDFKPAIRYAQEWVVSALNKVFSSTKLSGENLRELVKVKVFQANNFSRIAFNEADVGDKLWSVLAFYPNPVTHPFSNPSVGLDLAKSKYMPNLSHISAPSCANRLTLEQWNDNAKNVFAPGNDALVGDLVEFGYLDFADYTSANYNNPGKFEIEIRPSIANKYCSIAYLKKPADVNLISDTLEFPDAMTDIILEKTLQYISYKQGDQTTLYAVTDRDIARLSTLII